MMMKMKIWQDNSKMRTYLGDQTMITGRNLLLKMLMKYIREGSWLLMMMRTKMMRKTYSDENNYLDFNKEA